MSDHDDPEMSGGQRLWARYRMQLAAVPEPDALTLAAYAENRLGAAESEAVESWLAGHPEAIEAVLAARAASSSGVLALGRPDEIAAARALVPRGAPPRQLWRGIGWSSVAAGLMVACLIGYEAGVQTGGHNTLVLSSLAHEMGFDAGGNEGLTAYAMGVGDAGEEL